MQKKNSAGTGPVNRAHFTTVVKRMKPHFNMVLEQCDPLIFLTQPGNI